MPIKEKGQNATQVANKNVSTTAPTDGQVLTYSSSSGEWAPATPAEGSASFPAIDDQSSSNDDQLTLKDTEVVINDDSDDIDFRVESNGNAHMLFVDGGEDGVGIGTSDVKSALTIGTAAPVVTVDTDDASDNKSLTLCGGGAGSITRGPYVFLGGNEHATGANKGTIKLACGVGDGGSNVGDLYVYQGTGANNRMLIDQGETVFNEDSIDADFRVESNGSANMLFVDGGNNRVGVNSGSPNEALDVDGTVALKAQSSAPSATADYAKIYTEEYGNDSNVKLLLHMDGSNDGTTFTDSSASSHTVTPTGAVTKTAVKKFGTASAYFDGSDVLTIADSADFTFGADPFTIEFWAYPTSIATTWQCLAFMSGSNEAIALGYESASGQDYGFFIDINNGGSYNATPGSKTGKAGIYDDTWYHVAFVREATELRCYLNGVLKNTYDIGTTAINDPTGNFTIGGPATSGLTNDYRGYFDEFTITKEARYTADFTPARSAYPVTNLVIVDDNGGEYKLGRNW